MTAGVFQWKNLITHTPLFIGELFATSLRPSPFCRNNLNSLLKPILKFRLFLACFGRQHHHHLPAFHIGKLLDHTMLYQVTPDALDQAHADLLMSHFTAAKTQRDFGLVAVFQKLDQVTQLDVVVAFIRTRTKLDFLDLDLFLFEFGLVLLLAFCIFEFADVHDAADGRIRQRRDLDQIQFCFTRQTQRFRDGNNPEGLFFYTNESHLRCGNHLIDALRFILCYCNISTWTISSRATRYRFLLANAEAMLPASSARDLHHYGYARPPNLQPLPCRR